MTKILSGGAALLLGASPLLAGAIERAPQSTAVLFEQGNYAELSFGGVDPTVKGTDLLGFDTGDVAQGYGFVGLSYKHQFNDNLSAALIMEQPFGADIAYPTGSVVLGGTRANVDSTTFTALGRYRFHNNFGVHAGIRGSKADALVQLNGAAYGPIAGYEVELDDTWGVGYVVGASYEIPAIAARLSLTYNSAVEHDFNTTESGPLVDPDGLGPIPAVPLLNGTSTTAVKTPQSVALEGQTGIAADTLLFGSIRWVKWSEFRVDPENLKTFGGLVDLEDTTTYTLGVGRKFTENWSGSASVVYEAKQDEPISPLAPTNGRRGVTLAAIYTTGNVKVTTGINYSTLGDASPQTGGDARAHMRDSDLWGAGVRIGYSY